MSLSRKIADALDGQMERGVAGPLTVEDGPSRLSLDVAANTPVGVALEGLELTAEASGGWTLESHRAWGDRVAGRVTYLMEPLVVLEADEVGQEVELRSQRPSQKGDRSSYYEIRMGPGGRLRMSRVAFDAGDRRRKPCEFQLTREVLERLVDDLEATSAS